MRILSMTATFGKLEHTTLTLEPGLNIIEAPNEWGKSTWCAFLMAMLYGIDSRAHSATRQGLADKTRYDPWSGQLMSGRMELHWQGRDITIERSSTKQGPFRQFRAFESHTGAPVPELTADSCGQVLLGVEKEVFRRAGFIRFADLPVTQNDALRRRLNALVTTGDESGAAERLSGKLNKLKNEIRANRTHGRLPQAEAEHRALSEKLQQLEALRTELSRLDSQQQQLEAEENDLLAQAQAGNAARSLSLFRLQQERTEVEEKRRSLQAPAFIRPFLGLSPTDGVRQAKTDQKVYWEACGERHRPFRFVLCALPALLGLGLLSIPHWIGFGLWLFGVLASSLLISSEHSRQRRADATAHALSQKYHGMAPEEWPQRVQDHLTQLQQLEDSLSRLDSAIRDLQQPESSPADSPWAAQLQQCRQQLRQVHLHRGRCQGQMAALGSETDLRRALSDVQSRIRGLEDTLSALELAQQTLQQATAQLQRRFAPRITQRAKVLFGQMTGGRYNRLTLSQDLSLEAAAQNEDVLRSSLWRSDGTVDQLYLSLRLAVSAELTPKGPLVLDDALVRFDDARLKKAMAVLAEEAKTRQVIVFTCQSREQQSL